MPISLTFFSWKRMLLFCTLLILAVSAGASQWWWTHRQTMNPDEKVALDSYQVVAAVNKLIELPSNEVPTVATVTEENKLLDQPFFAAAQTGDKVLFYPQARKALLYRPSSNKLIEVTSLMVTNASE